MKSISKNWILAVAFILLFAVAPSVYADTITFDVTVTSDGKNDDPISKKALKSTDGSHYFYVTPTYFSRTGTIWVRSIQRDDTSVRSGKHTVYSAEVGSSKCFTYDRSVPGGVYYYMESYYSGGTGKSIRVKGRYTP